MASALIHEIRSFQMVPQMRARVARIWRPKRFKSDENDGIHHVLVDQRGDAIHAIIEENDCPHITQKMEEGRIYDIFKFHSKQDKSKYKVVDHTAQIFFNRRTKFVEVEDTFPPIPRHSFLLLEFHQLEAAMENQSVLIDVYGCLKTVVPEYQTPVQNQERMESKAEITLENLRREDLKITLWGDTARRFDLEIVQNHPPPLLIVVTSLKITLFLEQITPSTTSHTCMIIDPYLPQREAYKEEFSRPGDKVKIIPHSSRQKMQQELNQQTKKSVSDLNTLDPDVDKEMVCCIASISRFTAKNNWWYKGCPACRKQMKQQLDSNQFACTKHDVQVPLPCYRLYMTIEDHEDEVTVVLMGRQAEQIFGTTCQELVNKRAYPNEHTLPPEIENTVNQTYIFHLQLNQYRELVVKAVYPDQQDYPSPKLLQPTTATPAHPTSPKKRTIQTRSKALFNSETEKRMKREAEQDTSTSSVEKEEQQMKKNN